MTDPTGSRIHQALDGELDVEELSASERQEMAHLAFATSEAEARVRRLRSPGLAHAVLSEIVRRGDDPGTASVPTGGNPGEGWARTLFAPRTISVRPIWGLLAAAALAALILLPTGERPSSPALAPETEVEGVTVFVQFRLHAPEASEVRLAGTFTDWEPVHQLHRSVDGFWSVLIPMSPGIHDYAFMVDGTEWKPDPAAPAVDDGFGGQNSRLALHLVNGGRES